MRSVCSCLLGWHTVRSSAGWRDDIDARQRTSRDHTFQRGFVADDVCSSTELALSKARVLDTIWKQRLCFARTARDGKLHRCEADHKVYEHMSMKAESRAKDVPMGTC